MAFKDAEIKVILLDIEGTVCPISFVQDVLFPYALSALPAVLSTQWTSPTLRPYITAFPPSVTTSATTLQTHIHTLSASNSKDPALKALQGHLWAHGYETGDLSCPLFPDVSPHLHQWTSPSPSPSPSTSSNNTNTNNHNNNNKSPKRLMIYSSGSIAAQKLLFKHTTDGDVTALLSAYFDTTTAGPKMEGASYEWIMGTRPELSAREWLFLSDNVREVRAALEAGMKAVVVVREGNVPLGEEETEGLVVVGGFGELEI